MADPFEQIKAALDENLFVEAGAGTGKTRALVDRLVALVRGGTPVTSVVAITFTEKAAAELRDRVRSGLEAAEADASEMERGRLSEARAEMDAVQISTIHAFAAGIVRAAAAEAGVDPDFRVLDEVAEARRFEQRWRERLERLGQEAGHQTRFGRALGLGLSPGEAEKLARELWSRPHLAKRIVHWQPGAEPEWPDLVEWRGELEGYIDGKPAGDALADQLQALLGKVELLAGAADGTVREGLLAGSAVKRISGRAGARPVWGEQAAAVREAANAMVDELGKLLERLREVALTAILPAIAQFALDEREARCREGTLTFDDLIMIARDLVVEDEAVRERLRARYRCLLIDEFQDTDPAQWELAAAFARDPRSGEFEAGRLFLVGDPKQSIYRFRKADMAIYHRAHKEVCGLGGPVPLTDAHRSVGPIIDWVNETFGQLFLGEDPAVGPVYQVMRVVREERPAGPARWTFGEAVNLKAAEVREREARAVAAACRRAVEEGWEVFERDRRGLGEGEPARPHRARYGDIVILIPARTALPDIDRALEEAGIPARVEGGSLVFQTQELRDMINILGAVDDAGDPVAVVAALRSAAFACSDVELARHKLSQGSFNYLSPSNPEGPVTDALARLRDLHERRPLLSLADLVQRVLCETGMVASAITDRADRDAYRRARFVIEQARTFEADEPQPLRAFVEWLEERGQRPVRDNEGAVLDDDEDAVRIMTVHGAKGLEFPIVVMAGFGAKPPATVPATFAEDPASGQIAVCVGHVSHGTRFTVGPVQAVQEREKQHEAAERVRVLYVAATRACDHLVVSFFRGKQSEQSGVARLEDAKAQEVLQRLEDETATPGLFAGRLAGIGVELPDGPDAASLEAKRRVLVERARKLRVTSATALGKQGREDEAEPWSHGRGSTRVGRAVHAVIQTAPPGGEQGGALAASAWAQAVAEAVPERTEDVLRLARAATASEAMGRARIARRALREVPFVAELEGVLVEGFMDLVIEGDNGYEIVDWKTDGITTGEIPRRLEEYRLQAGLYALGLEGAVGQAPVRITYVFLAAGEERALDDIPGLMEEARRALRADAAR